MSINQPKNAEEFLEIQPSHGWRSINLGEVWRYRELLYFLTWRNIKVRYKQTVLGAAWAIIQPFFTMVIFSLFFGRLAKIPSDGIPYPIFSYAALVPWVFFANGLMQSSNTLVSSANLVRKVYFPRMVLPISAIISGAVDFILAFLVLLGMMLFYGITPTANVIWLPFLLLLALTTCLGAGMWLTAMNVQFRDVRFAVPFLIQAWLFATPIAYPIMELIRWPGLLRDSAGRFSVPVRLRGLLFLFQHLYLLCCWLAVSFIFDGWKKVLRMWCDL